VQAQAVATRLMIDCAGAQPAPGTIDVAEPPAPELVLRLREARVQSILGVAVPAARQAEILQALDFATQPESDGLDVTVPALRREDVTREVDLIEEVARIDGVDKLPATLPARRGAAGMLTHAQRVRRAAEDAMAGRGLHEIVGWSFTEPALLDRLLLGADHPLRDVVRLENPLSDAQSIMRPTLLGSLLDAAQHNVARNGADIAIFESGTVYRAAAAGDERAADEHHGLGVLLHGALAPRSWRGDSAQADFFAAKALLGALLEQLHVDWSVQPRDWPFLHPGAARSCLPASRRWLVGELHRWSRAPGICSAPPRCDRRRQAGGGRAAGDSLRGLPGGAVTAPRPRGGPARRRRRRAGASRACVRRPARCCRTSVCSTYMPASRSAQGGVRWHWRCRFALQIAR